MNPMKPMRNRPAFVPALFFALVLSASAGAAINPAEYQETIRVACVGDSITYGAGIKNRERDNYPTVLGRLLGKKFQVRNFGVNGATLLKNGDKPYWKQKAFTPTNIAPRRYCLRFASA